MIKEISKGADRIAGSEPLIFLFLTPWLIFPNLSRTLTIISLAAIPILWLIRPLAGRPISVRTPLNWPLLLMLGGLIPAICFSTQSAESISQATSFLCGLGVYFAIVNCDSRWRKPELVGFFIILSGAITSLIALLGTDWCPDKIPFLGRIARSVPHIFGESHGFQPNLVAGTMVLLLPVTITVVVTSGRMGRRPLMGKMRIRAWIGSGGIILMFFILLLTQSRIGIAVALLIVGILAAVRWRVINLFFVALALTMVILLAIGLVSNHLTIWMMDLDRLGWLGKGMANSWLQRQELWSNALKTIRDYPLTGAGLGAYDAIAWLNYPFFTVTVPGCIGNANNIWLQAGVDFGIFGYIAFAWLTGIVLLIGWVVRRRQRNEDRVLLTGVWLGLLGWFAFGFFNAVSLSTEPAFFVWLLMGVIVGNWRRDDINLLAADSRRVWGTDAIGVFLVLLLIVIMHQSPIWALNQGANLLDGAMINNQQVPSSALDKLDKAKDLPGALRRRALAQYVNGNEEQAEVLFHQDERSKDFLISLSKGYLASDLDKAEEIAQFGFRIFPDSGRLACLLGETYSLMGESMSAFTYYQMVPLLSLDFEGMEGRQAECYYRLGEIQGELGWWSDAVQSLNAAAVLDPDTLDYQIQQGWATYQATGELSQAVAIEEAALEKHPDDLAVVEMITELYYVSGRYQKGAEWAEKVVELDPKNPAAWLRLAKLQFALEELDIAKRSIAESLRLDPTNQEALALQAEWSAQ